MTGHLDGAYWVVAYRGSNAAHFVSVAEGIAFDKFLDHRDSMEAKDRAQFYKFMELSGRIIRIAIDEIESIHSSTPEQREIVDEITAELKARSIGE